MSLQGAYNISNSRTAGYVPVFGQNMPVSAKNSIPVESETTKIPTNDRTVGLSKMNENSSEKFSFFDFLDIINPLQHIPVVNTIYRSITGDEIKPAAMAMGGMLYGGPVGLISGAINGAVVEATGKDVANNILAMATSDEENNENKAILPQSTVYQVSLLSETPTKTLPHSQPIAEQKSSLAEPISKEAVLRGEAKLLSKANFVETKYTAEYQKDNQIISSQASLPMSTAPKAENTDRTETQKTPVFIPSGLIAQKMFFEL